MNPIAPELATTPPTTASASPLELVCPAGSLPALKTAIDHGADCVYLGFRDATNARNFAGLNFDEKAIAQGIEYAHSRARKVLVALNTYPQAASPQLWQAAIDRAASAGVDAVILADPGLMAYAAKHQPQQRDRFAHGGIVAHSAPAVNSVLMSDDQRQIRRPFRRCSTAAD